MSTPTTQCPQCGVVLNLPEGLPPGKRLKCPKCQARFQANTPGTRPPTSAPGVADAKFSSTMIRTAPDLQDLDLPTAAGDLRETFDLPMMTEADESAPGPAPAAAPAADAAALFRESAPAKRRLSAAEQRAQARRCPTCGGVVPAGMSLCSRCGLDLESGTRVDVLDFIEPAAPARRASGPPLGIAIVGGITLLASAILAVASFARYSNIAPNAPEYSSRWGFLLLGLICVFGVYAAVQFLRGKSARLLMASLMLAASVDVVALIALPIFQAVQTPPVVVPKAPLDPDAAADPDGPTGSGPEDTTIHPVTERLDQGQLTWGIIILLVDAAVLAYLFTPQVRRHFERR
ncbi:MAG TPA: hypothetical protein VF590_23185 [Isosphaeraceae bacterium]